MPKACRQKGQNSDVAPLSRTGKMPVPQRMSFLVEQAGKPVPKQVIENGARCESKPTPAGVKTPASKLKSGGLKSKSRVSG